MAHHCPRRRRLQSISLNASTGIVRSPAGGRTRHRRNEGLREVPQAVALGARNLMPDRCAGVTGRRIVTRGLPIRCSTRQVPRSAVVRRDDDDATTIGEVGQRRGAPAARPGAGADEEQLRCHHRRRQPSLVSRSNCRSTRGATRRVSHRPALLPVSRAPMRNNGEPAVGSTAGMPIRTMVVSRWLSSEHGCQRDP